MFALAEDLIGAALRQSVIFLSPLCSFQLPRIHYTHPLCCFHKMPGMCVCLCCCWLLILLSTPMYDIRFSTAKSSCVVSPLRQNLSRNKMKGGPSINPMGTSMRKPFNGSFSWARSTCDLLYWFYRLLLEKNCVFFPFNSWRGLRCTVRHEDNGEWLVQSTVLSAEHALFGVASGIPQCLPPTVQPNYLGEIKAN